MENYTHNVSKFLLLLFLVFSVQDAISQSTILLYPDTVTRLNTGADKIISWKLGADGVLEDKGFVPDSVLSVIEIKDQSNNSLLFFSDSNNNMVCKKVLIKEKQDHVDHVTYNIFDNLGRIRYILQPNFLEDYKNGESLEKCIQNFAFQYHYYADSENIKVKKIPGGAITYMIYDQFDRLVLYRSEGEPKWFVHKYDQQDRPIIVGVYTSNNSHEELQELVFASSRKYEIKDKALSTGYSLGQSFPEIKDEDVLTLTYYDDYSFLENDQLFNFQQLEGHEETPHTPFDLVTGEVNRTYMDTLPMMMVYYYDSLERMIQNVFHNPFGGVDRVSTSYLSNEPGFLDLPSKNTMVHAGLESVVIRKNYTYTPSSTEIIHQVNDQEPISLVKKEYNDSNLIDKKTWNSTLMAQYSYGQDMNLIQVFVSGLDDASLNQNLGTLKMNWGYQKFNLVNLDQGKISISSFELSFDRPHRPNYHYKNAYQYDGFNRLKSAELKVGIQNNEDYYQINNLLYDKNGNILKLRRFKNRKVIDDLKYAYSGNRLKSLTDFGDRKEGYKDNKREEIEYYYDPKGNTLQDLNRRIDSPILYNFLNLPIKIKTKDVESHYYYVNDHKLREILKNGEYVTEHVLVKNEYWDDEIQYKNNKIKFIRHDEGRLVKSGDKFAYEFFQKDHLNRIVAIINAEGEVVEVQNYFPFGLPMPLLNYADGSLGDLRQLQFDQYQFRMYDPFIGRFINPDPLAELEIDYSPYQFGFNNPSSNHVPIGLSVHAFEVP